MHTAAPPSAPGLRICRHSPQNPGRNSQPSSDMILNPLIKQCIAHLPHARDDSTKRDRSTCAFLGPTVGEETFLVAQGIKSLPGNAGENRVRSRGQQDYLEKDRAAQSSIHAWEIPWTEEPGGLQSTGLQRVRHNLVTKQQL